MEKVSRLEKYAEILGAETIKELRNLAKPLEGKRIAMINSTKDGGGVAELLKSMVPCFEELGINIDWPVLEAESSFFRTTKSFHNALQGESLDNIDSAIEDYKGFYSNPDRFDKHNKNLIGYFEKYSFDIVVVHDPQPLALAEKFEKYRKGSKWVWRCHIDTGKPNKKLGDFIHEHIKRYDAAIASTDWFKSGEGIDWRIIPPSIDPVTDKNRDLSEEETQSKFNDVLKKYGLDKNYPIITQVSRLDKWKDPMGVIDVFKNVRKNHKCQLVLMYSGASDDPEGQVMYQEVNSAKEKSPYKNDIHLIEGKDPLVVNAFQRYSSIVLQKSIREGFALTVTEALWKSTPVIATNVGGISLQVQNDKNGYLSRGYEVEKGALAVDNKDRERHIDEVSANVNDLLLNPAKARRFGEYGKEHVKRNFLTPRHVKDYLTLFNSLYKKT